MKKFLNLNFLWPVFIELIFFFWVEQRQNSKIEEKTQDYKGKRFDQLEVIKKGKSYCKESLNSKKWKM